MALSTERCNPVFLLIDEPVFNVIRVEGFWRESLGNVHEMPTRHILGANTAELLMGGVPVPANKRHMLRLRLNLCRFTTFTR